VVVWVLLIISTLVLGAKEIFQLMHSQKLYFFNWENWVQWGIIINVVTVSFHTNPLTRIGAYSVLVARWQHHAAAIGVFLVWGELMLMIGRLPLFGIYVQMFTTVAKNFFKFLAAYFCLLIAFALSFAVLFPNYQSFNGNALVKVLVMMAGEIEYENFVYENGSALFPGTSHMMILFFVVLISIILMNLLVGLAVSDIQGLQKSAGLDRLVRQTELISHIESMLFTRLLLFLPKKFLSMLHQNALVVPHAYNWTFRVRPNDLREERLSREITECVHALVARRYQSRKRRPFSRYTARADKQVRREKSFTGAAAHAGGQQVEEQLVEIRGEIGALRRSLEAAASGQTSMQSAWSREPTSQGLAERIQKSLGVKGPGRDEEEGRRIGDLVRNLTNLALAITEDRPDRATEEDKVEGGKEDDEDKEDTDDDESVGKRRLVVSTSEGGVKDLEKRCEDRKFHSLDKKLRRTNLMKRRESQALLEGIRRSRLSNTNMLPDDKEELEQ